MRDHLPVGERLLKNKGGVSVDTGAPLLYSGITQGREQALTYSNYPDGLSSRDYDHIDGVQYAPEAPPSERIMFEGGEMIRFDFAVFALTYGDVAVRVDVEGIVPISSNGTAIDFLHEREFEDVDSAHDWVYAFVDGEPLLSYEQTKAMIRNGK